MLLASLTVVARRALSDRLMLFAATVSILLATTLLAASPIYADSVTLASLHRILRDGESGASLEVISRTLPERFDEYDLVVRQQVEEAFATTGATVAATVVGTALELPVESEDGLVPLASVRYVEEIESRASLVDGIWPEAGGELHEMALLAGAAASLGLELGDTVELTSRHDSSVIPIRVVGIFEVADPGDLFWHGDTLLESGSEESASFRTFGPFVTGLDAVLDTFTHGSADMRWRVFPDHEALTVAGIPDQRTAVGSLDGRLNSVVGGSTDSFRVETGLRALLAQAEQSVVSTRSSVLMLSAQMAILAGYSLIHTAGLLVDGRAVETGLLRARGAGNGQLFAISATEGVMLTLPAVLLAPTLASLILHILGRVGPLGSIGLTLDPRPGSTAYALAVIAGIFAVVALSVPAYRSSRTFNDSLVARSRQETRPLSQRAGWDVALITLAVVAFWQLSTHGASISSTVQDRWGVDPLLVAVPALGLLGGGVLALRFVPLAAGIIERLTGRGKTTVGALSAWQIARRPQRYSRSALLLIIAVSIGLFVSAYTHTWSRSQVDQAAFRAGADLRLVPYRGATSVPDLVLRQAHEDLEGVEHSMPVATSLGQLIRGGPSTRYFALDAAVASKATTLRDDLAGGGFDEMMAGLVEARPVLASIALPGEPRWILLDIEIESEEPCGAPFDLAAILAEQGLEPDAIEEMGLEPEVPESCLAPLFSVVVVDRHGMLHRLPAGTVEANKGVVTVRAALTNRHPDGRVLTAAYPLSLVAIELTTDLPGPFAWEQEGQGRLRVMISWGEDGNDRQMLDLGGQWTGEIALPEEAFDWRVNPTLEVNPPDDDTAIGFILNSGAIGFSPDPFVHFAIRPAGSETPDTIPLVVTGSLLDTTGASIGDLVDVGRFQLQGQAGAIAGAIDLFPTVTPGRQDAVVIDLATAQAVSYRPGIRLNTASEYWLSIDESHAASVTERLKERPLSTLRVTDRFQQTQALITDPLALSTIAALSLGFVAALVFAVIAFTVNIVVLARERRTEFTLLRALGLSLRQLRSWLLLEQGALVVAGLMLGTAIGLALARVVLPLISVTQGGAVPIPPPVVVYPAGTIVVLELTVLAVLAVVILALARMARRHDLAAQLRMGDE